MQLETEQLNPVLLKSTYFMGSGLAHGKKLGERTVYDYEIEYYTNGGGQIIIDGKPVHFDTGDINIRKPGQQVCGVLPYDCCLICIDFQGNHQKRENYLLGSAEQAQPRYDNPLLSALPDKLTGGRTEQVYTLMKRLHNNQFYIGEEHILERRADLFLLLKELYRLSKGTFECSRQIQTSVSHIRSHFIEEISIADLICESGLSKAYFHKQFKNYTGTTPGGLVTALRMERAKYLLTASNEQIGNIGALCGYNDHVYFNYVFKKETGLSPGEYRRLYGSAF